MAFIFNLFVQFLNGVVGLFLTPINLLVATAFPDFQNIVNSATIFINTYVEGPMSYFLNILPPTARGTVLFYLDILIIIWTSSLAFHYLMKLVIVVKNLKIW